MLKKTPNCFSKGIDASQYKSKSEELGFYYVFYYVKGGIYSDSQQRLWQWNVCRNEGELTL